MFSEDQLKYFSEIDDESLQDLIDDVLVDGNRENPLQQTVGDKSASKSLVALLQEYEFQKYLTENYGDALDDADDDALTEMYQSGNRHIQENIDNYSLRNVVEMAFFKAKRYPIDGTDEEQQEWSLRSNSQMPGIFSTT